MTMLDPTVMTVELPITLRQAQEADLPKLEWYGQYTHFRVLLQRTFADQRAGRRRILVADCGGFPIGQICINFLANQRAQHPRGYLYSLRVMEMFRGHGIGTRLIEEAEYVLCERGYRWASIGVSKENTGARRLYQRLGYRVFKDDPGEWEYTDHEGRVRQMYEPCWLLEKRLAR